MSLKPELNNEFREDEHFAHHEETNGINEITNIDEFFKDDFGVSDAGLLVNTPEVKILSSTDDYFDDFKLLNESIDLESNILETTKTRDDCFKDLNILQISGWKEKRCPQKRLCGKEFEIAPKANLFQRSGLPFLLRN